MKTLDKMISKLVVGSSIEAVTELHRALEDGRIRSTMSANEVLARIRPHTIPVHLLHDLMTAWRVEEARGMTSHTLSMTIRACLNCCELTRRDRQLTELVWTGPVATSGGMVRSTWSVFLEMIESADKHLLVVGYNLTSETNTTNAILKALAAAKKRGCEVTIALHDNGQNLSQLKGAWPEKLALPRILRWIGRQGDELASLHAKVLVADKIDLLVTSANLSYHGMESNIELGLRTRGELALQVVRHFEALEREGFLLPYN